MTVDDPILIKRARMARLASLGIRLGLALYLVSAVCFFWGVAAGFTATMATLATIGLLVGSAALAPAMVLKYTVKAADRADREGSW